LEVLDKISRRSKPGRSARTVALTDDERAIAELFSLDDQADDLRGERRREHVGERGGNKMVQTCARLRAGGAECVVICAQLESELVRCRRRERPII
jgi:hypothetical protein